MRKINHTGEKHGRITVIGEYGAITKNRRRIYWNCRCECGKEFIINADGLKKTKSCGCILNEMIAKVNLSHGESKRTAEYRTWARIKSRCYSKGDQKYPVYGGRGIKVCDRWLQSYSNFLEDMGRRPEDKNAIDRINVNGDYCKENCRWSDSIEQGNNTTTNVLIEYGGLVLNLRQWADKLGYKYKYFHALYRYKGKTIEELADGRI